MKENLAAPETTQQLTEAQVARQNEVDNGILSLLNELDPRLSGELSWDAETMAPVREAICEAYCQIKGLSQSQRDAFEMDFYPYVDDTTPLAAELDSAANTLRVRVEDVDAETFEWDIDEFSENDLPDVEQGITMLAEQFQNAVRTGENDHESMRPEVTRFLKRVRALGYDPDGYFFYTDRQREGSRGATAAGE